jgi:hypothetical protein
VTHTPCSLGKFRDRNSMKIMSLSMSHYKSERGSTHNKTKAGIMFGKIMPYSTKPKNTQLKTLFLISSTDLNSKLQTTLLSHFQSLIISLKNLSHFQSLIISLFVACYNLTWWGSHSHLHSRGHT